MRHSHPWSQIICVKSGVLAMLVAGQRYLAPREFAIWVPAGVEHSSYNRKTTRFVPSILRRNWTPICLPNLVC